MRAGRRATIVGALAVGVSPFFTGAASAETPEFRTAEETFDVTVGATTCTVRVQGWQYEDSLTAVTEITTREPACAADLRLDALYDEEAGLNTASSEGAGYGQRLYVEDHVVTLQSTTHTITFPACDCTVTRTLQPK